MGGYYHQDERDAAAGCVTIGIIVIAAIALLVLGLTFMATDTPIIQHGSNAGANAATVEEIRAGR